MTTIVTRSGKGSPLSWVEADENFTNLNIDKQEHSTNLDLFSTITPTAAGLSLLDDTTAGDQRTTLGLGNVDNTSDSTKNSAIATLTNKTLTTPIINTNINFSGVGGIIQVGGVDVVSVGSTVVTGTSTATLVGNGPAFSATASGTITLTSSATTKILLAVENYDTNNNFVSSTFTPTVAGYYHFEGQVDFSIATTAAPMFVYVYKNGSGGTLVKQVREISSAALAKTVTVSGEVLMNGTTDTLELYAMQSSGANQGVVVANTSFSGFLARTV